MEEMLDSFETLDSQDIEGGKPRENFKPAEIALSDSIPRFFESLGDSFTPGSMVVQIERELLQTPSFESHKNRLNSLDVAIKNK